MEQITEKTEVKRVGKYISLGKGITAREEGSRLVIRRNGKISCSYGGSSITQGFSTPLTGEDKSFLLSLVF